MVRGLSASNSFHLLACVGPQGGGQEREARTAAGCPLWTQELSSSGMHIQRVSNQLHYRGCTPQDGTVVAWSEKPDGSWARTLVHDFGAPVWRVSWSVTGGLLAASDAKNNVTIWKETLDHQWQQIVE